MVIRVLHIVTYMGRGGLETMIMNYYRNIDRSKVQFDFLVHRDFEADYDKEIIELGGEIYRVPPMNPLSIGYYQALDDFFSNHKYDIVHSHLDCMSAYPLWFAKKYGVKTRIAHAHNKNQDKNLKYIIKVISKKWMPRYATHLFACGQQAGKWMFSGQSFIVVNNAINAREFVYSKEQELICKKKFGVEGKFVLGHIGRFAPQKNHFFLIDVFNKVLEKHAEAVLLLVGTGDGQNDIIRKVQSLNIQNSVHFLGKRNDIADILQAMDVFVFPSLYEGVSVATIEAQAAGVPCVLSDQVPVECRMSQDVEFVSLHDSVDVWAEVICKYRKHKKTNNYIDICNKGYDIVQNVQWLQTFYLQGEIKDE